MLRAEIVEYCREDGNLEIRILKGVGLLGRNITVLYSLEASSLSNARLSLMPASKFETVKFSLGAWI